MTLKGSRSGLLGNAHHGRPLCACCSTPSCCRCRTFALAIACPMKVMAVGEEWKVPACRLPTGAPAKYALALMALPASRVAIFSQHGSS